MPDQTDWTKFSPEDYFHNQLLQRCKMSFIVFVHMAEPTNIEEFNERKHVVNSGLSLVTLAPATPEDIRWFFK